MLVGQARNWRRSNGKRNLLASVGMCLGSKLQESAQCQTLRSMHVQNWILKSPRRWNHCDMCQSFLRSKWVQDNLRCLLRMKMSGLALSTGNRSGSKLSWLIEVPTLRKDGCKFLGSKNHQKSAGFAKWPASDHSTPYQDHWLWAGAKMAKPLPIYGREM